MEVDCEGGGWLGELATALLEGAGSSLEEVKVETKASEEGLQQLARAFRQGACPRQKALYAAHSECEGSVIPLPREACGELERVLKGRAVRVVVGDLLPPV